MNIDNGIQSSALQKTFMEMSDNYSNYSKLNTNFDLSLGSNATLTWSGLFTILKNRWLNDEIINACIVLFQQNLENQHHNKIIVYKTFFQQYLLSNQLQQARNMLYGNKYQENPQNFFHDHNTLLFVMNLNNVHWNLF